MAPRKRRTKRHRKCQQRKSQPKQQPTVNRKLDDVVDDLLRLPPSSDEVLRGRLASFDDDEVRSAVVTRLKSGEETRTGEENLLFILKVLGAGRQVRRLLGIALDGGRHPRTRFTALGIIKVTEPKRLKRLVRSLDAEERIRITEAKIASPFFALEPDEVGLALAGRLVSLPKDSHWRRLFAFTEQCRRLTALTPAEAYGAVADLGEMFPFNRFTKKVLAREGNQARRLNEPDAFISPCDGSGELNCFARLLHRSGVLRLVTVGLHVDGRVLHGNTAEWPSGAAALEHIRSYERVADDVCIPIPIDEARALAWATCCSAMDEETEASLELLRGPNRSSMAPLPQPWEGSASLAASRRLLRRPEYATWHIRGGDLNEAGAGRPPLRGSANAWIDETLPKLGCPELCSRLVALVEYQSRWHRWNGENEEARLCVTIARDLRNDVTNSNFTRALLERSVASMRADSSNLLSAPFHSGEDRRRVRDILLQTIDRPTNYDLAFLDLATAAVTAFDESLRFVPAHHHPGYDRRIKAATEIAHSFLASVYVGDGDEDGQPDSRSVESDELRLAATESVVKTGIPEGDSETVGSLVLFALAHYLEQVCSICPHPCVDEPDNDATDAFFSDDHPLGDRAPLCRDSPVKGIQRYRIEAKLVSVEPQRTNFEFPGSSSLAKLHAFLMATFDHECDTFDAYGAFTFFLGAGPGDPASTTFASPLDDTVLPEYRCQAVLLDSLGLEAGDALWHRWDGQDEPVWHRLDVLSWRIDRRSRKLRPFVLSDS